MEHISFKQLSGSTKLDEGWTEMLHAVRTIKRLHRQAKPLQPVSRNQDLPLSFAQQRLWSLHQLEPSSPAYNTFRAYRIKGQLHLTALEQSFNEIIRRHEILRTTFPATEGQPVQVIAPALTLTLSVVDIQQFPESEREIEALRLTNAAIQRPFNLAQGPLIRVTLLQLGREEYVLFTITHHILFAGQVWNEFNRELSVLYETFSAGKTSPIPDLPIQYADFAYWQREWLQGEVLTTLLSYWKQQLGGHFSLLSLPIDHPQSAVPTFQGARQSLALSESLTESLKSLSRREGVTLFVMLLAAFKVLLYRYTTQQDILIFSPAISRTRFELRKLIGLFTNFLPLRTELFGDLPFRELLSRVRETVMGAYAHQEMPLEKLVEVLQPQHSLSYTSLFQVIFIYHNTPTYPLTLSGLTLTPLKIGKETTRFDLSLLMEDSGKSLIASLGYKTDRFDTATITQMREHFQTLLEGIVTDPNQRLSELPCITEVERQQLPVFKDPSQFASQLDTANLKRIYQAPKDALEVQLTKIWEHVLKVQPIGINDNFFYLGGNSLLAVSLLDHIEKHLGKSLLVTKIFQAPTIAQLANILRHENDITSWRVLEIVQPQGTRIPFFFVGASANAHALARVLGTHQPLYVLNIFSLSALNNITSSININEIAKQFIKEIQMVQLKGPYCLGAFCGDFKLTLEIALQLQFHRQEVALLIFFDSPINRYKSRTKNQSRFSIYRHWKNFLERGHNYLFYKIRTKLKHLVTLLRKLDMNIRQRFGIKLNRWMQAHQFIEAFRGAEAKHIPNYYYGTITLFLTKGSYLQYSPELARLVADKVEVYEIIGDHDNLFVSPQVEALGEQLKRCLDKVANSNLDRAG